MWVKICGITRVEDALVAHELGADAIGFVFANSLRRINVAAARDISQKLDRVLKVGVFVNPQLTEVQEIRVQCGLDVVQLHGSESPEFCQAVGGPVIKALRMQDEASISQIRSYANVWNVLVDAYVRGKPGGTGKQIGIGLLSRISDFSNIIIAGGLNAENVKSVFPFRPFGIDVSSGVEVSPGIKDHEKLTQLFHAVKS